MEKTSLPGLPVRRAADYILDGFDPPRHARVIYVPQETKPHYTTIEVQAFEVDAAGAFCSAPNGSPSCTAATPHQIMLSGVGDTHTLVPGWVRVVGTFDIDTIPEVAQVLDVLPGSGSVGDFVWCNEKLYKWSIGMLEEIMQGKAQELAGMLRNVDLMDFDL